MNKNLLDTKELTRERVNILKIGGHLKIAQIDEVLYGLKETKRLIGKKSLDNHSFISKIVLYSNHTLILKNESRVEKLEKKYLNSTNSFF